MMREYVAIIQRNVVTPIAIAIAVLVVALLLLNEVRDAIFISVVIILNVSIAIVQEIRAHHALRKLEIMNAPRAHRLMPSGDFETIALEEIMIGDTLKLGAGDQVPADGKLLSSRGLECDEALLTGEAHMITKQRGDTVYAGSTAMAGSATLRVTAIGNDTKAGAMTATLKQYHPQLTPLQKSISQAIQLLTYGALGIIVLIIVVYSLRGHDVVTIVKTITTAGIVLVPEGLLLASTLLLAFGAINLARRQVLPQKLSAIEAMALLDVLCVDKTGTLTSDVIQFERFEQFAKPSKQLEAQLGVLAREAASGNATGEAIARAIPEDTSYTVKDILAFSSQRKMSAVRLLKAGKAQSLFMGAPEVLSPFASLTTSQQKLIDGYVEQGLRVLLVAVLPDVDSLRTVTPHHQGRAAGIVLLSNQLRVGVTETVAYLQEQGVNIKVISGDNPQTVRHVAQTAGIRDSHKIMTGAELSRLSDAQWEKQIPKTTIFARVLPEQKQRLIATFRRQHHFTGMVGDGVNDALALKEADLGVAMFAGASASRRVADLILLDNSFTSLPIGMRLGNKIMQAIELIASLFFHKIIYGLVLLFTTMALSMVYPFLPRHITFMNIFLVTLPTILWTLFPPDAPRRVNPRLFWKRTLGRIAPVAIISGLAVTTVYWWLEQQNPNSELAIYTSTVLAATLFGSLVVFMVPRMLGVPKSRFTRLTYLLFIISVIVVMAGTFLVAPLRIFFDFTAPATEGWWLLALVVVASIAAQYWLISRWRPS